MNDKAAIMKQVVKLDFDAIEAYDEAIKRLDDRMLKAKLEEFRQDHVRHTENLGAVLENMQFEAPSGPDALRILTQGKVIIADLLGYDKAIMRATYDNVLVLQEAYENALQIDDLDAAAQQTLAGNLDNVKRHRAWIESQMPALERKAS